MKIDLSPKIGICPVCILKTKIRMMRQTITGMNSMVEKKRRIFPE
jgi:hypothetical protein